jgi:peroxiredoxin-like protein
MPETDARHNAAEILAGVALCEQLDLDSIDPPCMKPLGVAIPEADDPRLAGLDGYVDYLESRIGRTPRMKPLPHTYTVTISGGRMGHATLASDGVPELRTDAPLDFGGPGNAWSPEQMLLGAVEACFLLTFRAIAKASGIEFTSLAVEGEGIVDRVDGRTRFTEIVLRPRLAVPAGVDAARVRRALEKAEHACLISASLATPVRLEPDIAG